MTLYTWRDIGLEIQKANSDLLRTIYVYPNELVIPMTDKTRQIITKIAEIFPDNFDKENMLIHMDLDEQYLPIVIDVNSAAPYMHERLPLFKESIYAKVKISHAENKLAKPVIAFQSCKGGVGRTVSLLSFLSALYTRIKPDKESVKALVIDGDIEAPGLSFLSEEYLNNPRISYMDILSLVYDYDSETIDSMVKQLSDRIRQNTIPIDNGTVRSEFYFLPTYRSLEQVLAINNLPADIVMTREKRFIIGTVLAKLAALLDADAVFVDLRAGFSEFSAPLLFDHRIAKIYVTTTSTQSVMGLEQMLKRIYGTENAEISPFPNVLLSMVVKELPRTIIDRMKDRLTNSVIPGLSSDKRMDVSFVYEIPFSGELVHLDGFNDIFKLLQRSALTETANDILRGLVPVEGAKDYTVSNRYDFLRRLHVRAEDMLTGDKANTIPLYPTMAIKRLRQRFLDKVPLGLVTGPRGSGKTYLFEAMLQTKRWETFIDNDASRYQTLIAPVLTATDTRRMRVLLKDSEAYINSAGRIIDYSCPNAIENKKNLINEIIASNNSTKFTANRQYVDWLHFVTSGLRYGVNLKDLDGLLGAHSLRMLFIIDGLEDVFKEAGKRLDQSFNRGIIVKSLIQDFIRYFSGLKLSNIGLLIFIDSDSVIPSLKKALLNEPYSITDLQWPADEALRLVLWMAQSIGDEFQTSLSVENLAYDIVVEKLELLWGKRLGRLSSQEAIAIEWIRTALSNYHEEIEPRDIIRFLSESTKTPTQNVFSDRYIMPADIKKAADVCSEAKIRENSILRRLKEMPASEKYVPFNWEATKLPQGSFKVLESLGYIKMVDEARCYLPEIIRRGLGFAYREQ